MTREMAENRRTKPHLPMRERPLRGHERNARVDELLTLFVFGFVLFGFTLHLFDFFFA